MTERNPWNAGTPEWAHDIPDQFWGVRSIPYITSRYPLWDQPGIVERMDAGGYYLPDAQEGLRETIVTSAIDARPQLVARVTGPAWVHDLGGGLHRRGVHLSDLPLVSRRRRSARCFAVVCVLYWLWTSTAQIPERDDEGRRAGPDACRPTCRGRRRRAGGACSSPCWAT